MIWALDGMVPEIDPTAWVAPDANVIGKVRLGPGASVWFGATLRGDMEWIEVGEGSNIQDGAVLHTDSGYPLGIGPGCTIGHKAILHGCTLRANVLIGMGATVLNGAEIGQDSLIGACALITERKAIPPGSLVVGSPGKVVRSLDAEAIEGLRRSARHYQDNAARYRNGLAPVG